MIMTLSDIKKILDYYDSHSSWLDKIFFPEDRPIAYIRKHYEVLSQYHSQDKILEYDRDSLRYVFKRICSTSVFPEDEPLYSAIGQFQNLFGLCEDGKPYNYKLNIL